MDEKELQRRIADMRKRFGVNEETARGAASIKGDVEERMKEHADRMQKIREAQQERKRK